MLFFVTVPASLKFFFFYGGPNLYNNSKNAILLLGYHFSRQGQFYWLPITLFRNSPHSIGQGTSMKMLPENEYIYFNYTFWNWGYNHRMVLGNSLCSQWYRPKLKLHWLPDLHKHLLSLVGHSGVLVLLK